MTAIVERLAVMRCYCVEGFHCIRCVAIKEINRLQNVSDGYEEYTTDFKKQAEAKEKVVAAVRRWMEMDDKQSSKGAGLISALAEHDKVMK